VMSRLVISSSRCEGVLATLGMVGDLPKNAKRDGDGVLLWEGVGLMSFSGVGILLLGALLIEFRGEVEVFSRDMVVIPSTLVTFSSPGILTVTGGAEVPENLERKVR